MYKPQAASARTAHLPSSATKSSSANPAIAADISEGEEDDDDEDEALEALSTASVRRRQMRLATGDQPAREPSLAPAAASAEQQQKNQQQQQQPKTRYVAAKVRMRNRKSEQKLGGQSSSAAGSASTSTAVKDSSQAETASPPAAATATSTSPSPASSPPAAATTTAGAGASSPIVSSAGQPRKGPRSLTEDEVRAREALNLLRTLEHDVGKHESIAQLVDMVYDYRRRTDGKELVVEGDKGRERKEEVKVETAAGAVSQVVVASPAAKGKAESVGRRGSEYSLFLLFRFSFLWVGERNSVKGGQ